MSATVGIVFIGTSEYVNFFPRWKQCVDDNFLVDCNKTIFAFTDRIDEDFLKLPDTITCNVPHMPWPYVTLGRFRMMTDVKHLLSNMDYVFFLDADLFPVSKITLDEITAVDKPLTGVRHPGQTQNPYWQTFEVNPNSTACVLKDVTVPQDFQPIYHQGCFWGGKAANIITMIETLSQNVLDDMTRGVVACWHDESHMNKYFLTRWDEVHTLHSGFAWPEGGDWSYLGDIGLEKRMLHAEKTHDTFPRFPGKDGEGPI